MWQNECASSGCNYPEGECLGVCQQQDKIPDLVAMWDSIPQKERDELVKAFAQGFNDQVNGK